MKDSIRVGEKTELSLTVDPERVTRHMGEDLGVYATPLLIRDIERVCHDFLQAYVDAGEDSVGTHIDLKHLAPTLEGAEVTVFATVSAIDRRAVTFEVSVKDAFDELATARHSRFVVDKNKLKERLQAKAGKLRGQ